MPLYEYRCRECASRFEALRPMAEADAPIVCKACGSPKTERTPSRFYAHSGGRALTPTGGCACASGGACACSH